ncbi:MAG: nucleoside-diphosphate kinase [Candidatus Pacearchaeota archaeon]|nr:nucleoside-diphosphate kinase [Candidatus Pacearchaeota archaeon]
MVMQKTLVLIKPDGVQRALIGKILSRFEDAGLKIIAMKMSWIDKDFAEKHYWDVKQRYDQRILDNLVRYIREGPVVAMVIEGVEAVAVVKKIVGATYPSEAAPGTIRGDFAHMSKAHANADDGKVGNLIHASAEKDAEHEISLWFTKKEMHSYKTVHDWHALNLK